MSSRILCIESSSELCSVALFEDAQCLSYLSTQRVNSHAEVLASLIKNCMDDAGWEFADLQGVAVSNGPGSYTSLRVGLSTAKGICFGTGAPLMAISSDAILIHGNLERAKSLGCSHIIAMIDARRMEAYCTIYSIEDKTMSKPTPVVFEKDSFLAVEPHASKIAICGNGAKKWLSLANHDTYLLLSETTHATFMGPIALKRIQEGTFDDLAYITPFYIKPPNITAPKKNKWIP